MANAITIRIDADAARAITQINETALATGRLDAAGKKAGATWTSAGRTLTNAGHSMTRNLTIPIAIAGGAAVKTAVDFNTSLTHIQALVGASTKQMGEYQKSILALAPTVGKGPKELADALYFVTSSGFQGAAALRILTAGAKASAAGLGDTQTVVDLVTSAVNAYGEKALTASKATDVLTAAVREGKAEPQELAQAMGRVIPLANAMGVSFGEASGTVAALTLSGLDANEAVTAVRGALTNILKPGADAKKALAGVGISAAALKQEVREKGLQAALIDLNDRFKGNTTEMGRVIPNARALAGVLALVGPNATKAAGTIRDVNSAAGDSEKAFAKASDSAQFKFNQSLAQLQVTGVKIGTDLIPILISIAGTVGSVAEAFDGLSPTMQKVIIDGALVAAALGPIVSIGGNVAKVIGVMTSAYAALSGAQAASAASTAGFAGGIGQVEKAAAPAALGVGALASGVLVMAAALGVGLYAASTMDAGTNALGDAFDGASSSAEKLRGAVASLGDAENAATDAHLAHRQAVLNVSSAEKALIALRKAGKQGTDEYKQAVLNLDEAQQHEKETKQGVTHAQRHVNTLTKDGRDAIQGLAKQMRNATRTSGQLQGTADRVGRSLHTGAERADQFQSNMHDVEQAALAASRKLQGVDGVASRAAKKIAIAASAAQGLADSLNRIPTQKEINVFIHTTSQLTTIESQRINRPHGATGAIVRRPTVALIGEKETEAVIPLSRTRGNSPLPSGKLRLGGGDTYNVTIQARDYDAKKLKRDLDRIAVRRG